MLAGLWRAVRCLRVVEMVAVWIAIWVSRSVDCESASSSVKEIEDGPDPDSGGC